MPFVSFLFFVRASLFGLLLRENAASRKMQDNDDDDEQNRATQRNVHVVVVGWCSENNRSHTREKPGALEERSVRCRIDKPPATTSPKKRAVVCETRLRFRERMLWHKGDVSVDVSRAQSKYCLSYHCVHGDHTGSTLKTPNRRLLRVAREVVSQTPE